VTFGGDPALNVVMRNTVLAGLLLVTAACGAYQFPGGGSSPGTGKVSGRVLSVPCAPVDIAGSPCPGRAVAGLEIDFVNGGTSDAVTTDSAGDYSIALAAGMWSVHLKGYMRMVSGPTSVTVTDGADVVANYVLDSGIRAPVPQQ